MTERRPTSDELRAIDRRHVWHPYTPIDRWEQPGREPPVIDRAEGVYYVTREGRRLLDGFGSWWVCNLGHGYPRVRDAVRAQLDRMAHVAIAGVVHEPAAVLAERLCAAAPPGLTRAFYSDNGSTSVEVAIRAAFQFFQQNDQPKRRRFVSLEGAYHGDTIGAVSVGGIPLFHERFGPLTFETLRAPTPAGGHGPHWHVEAFAALETLMRDNASELAAVVIEPLVQGAAGMLMYPPSYLRSLRALCDELGVFLIADEVFVGFGRTGTLFACEQAEITPDFLCLSKGLTAGVLPFAATLTTERVYDGFRGSADRTLFYGHSYCGHPLGCAAALAVLDAFEHDDVLDNAAARSLQMQAWAQQMKGRPGVADARVTGTVAAVQIGGDSDYTQTVGEKIVGEAFDRGAWLRPLGNVVYLVPALTITAAQLDELLAITTAAVDAALTDAG